MKVTITGATGFIGRNLAERFSAEGLQVLATGRNQEVGRQLEQSGAAFAPADILDAGRLAEIFGPADCAIHCAALAGDWGRPDDFFDANVVGTRNVVSACLQNGIQRLIFLSSPSIYFNGSDSLDITEDEPLPEHMLTDYSKTKLQAEQELLEHAGRGLKVMIFRPRAVYGPHDQIIMPRILRMAEKKRFPLIAGGQAWVDLTYIDNLVDAVKLGIEAPDEAWGQVYSITNGDPIRIRDWFAKVLEIFDEPFRPKNVPMGVAKSVAWFMEFASRLPFGPTRPTMTRFSVGYMGCSMTLSIEKARRTLGYQPKVSTVEGFERYANWVRSQQTETLPTPADED